MLSLQLLSVNSKIKSFYKFVIMIFSIILMTKANNVSPIVLGSSPLFQIGAYALTPSQISTYFAPASSATTLRTYPIPMINTYSFGFSFGFGFKKLYWDYPHSTYIADVGLSSILAPSSISVQVRSFYGFALLELQVSYILIDISLNKNFFCQLLTPSITLGPYSAGTLLHLNISHSFSGYSSQTTTSTYISRMNLQANDSTQYVALLPVVVTAMNPTTLLLTFSLSTNVAYFSSLEVYVLYINPIEIRSSYLYVLNINPLNTIFSGTPYTVNLYSDISICIGTNDFFVGINGWQDQFKLGVQIVSDSLTSKITVVNFVTSAIFYTAISKACQAHCPSTQPYLYLLDFRCYDICPIGTIGNNSNLLCEDCINNCSSCQSMSITNCTGCINGTFLYDFECLLTCPVKMFEDTSNNECVACDPYCQVCHNSSSNCSSCISGKYLMDTTCLAVCPSGYYPDSSNLCTPCFTNCAHCTTAVTCNLCFTNYFLSPTGTSCGNSCPQNYFPNTTTGICQIIKIQGCASGLYYNGVSICLMCDASKYFIFNPTGKTCICKVGYKLISGVCYQICGDGIIDNLACDDGNTVNGDGCSSSCTLQNGFTCSSLPNGPSLMSLCTYLANIGIKILSQTKVDGENTMKLILNVSPAPGALTSNDIKSFLNMKIANSTISMNNAQIIYQNGIAQIYVPYTNSIEGQELYLWTLFDPNKYASQNLQISSLLQGDNSALLYSNSWLLYKNLSTFNFSMAIFVCIIAVASFWKHKMIGLQLILPFQVIFYSQSFYKLKSISTTLYTAFKPVSFSIFTPSETQSKNNTLFKIGMTGGFLENYNFLGLLFLVSTACLIFSMFKVQLGEFNRFKNKKSIKDWVKFAQFRRLLETYQTFVWKGFYVSLCLSTIPLIFAIPSAALTQVNNFQPASTFDIISQRCSNYFILLFLFALFYTSIPTIFYNNNKSFLKRHIVRQQCQKFKYEAKYCVFFELHYLSIGCILAFAQPTPTILYILSSINAIFFLYLIIKRPYQSKLDNFGAILSNFIVLFYLTMNLVENITSSGFNFVSEQFEGIFIIALLLIQIVIGFFRFIIFYKLDITQTQKSQGIYKDKLFNYVRDDAFNRLTNHQTQQEQMNKMMKQFQPNYNKSLFQGAQKQKQKKQLIKTMFFFNQNQNQKQNQKQIQKPLGTIQSFRQKFKKQQTSPTIPTRKQIQQRLRKNLLDTMEQSLSQQQ